MYWAMGSPWSPATPGAKYCGALIPPDAVSIGRPGIEIGAPGLPGFASKAWSWTITRSDESGAKAETVEPKTVTDCVTHKSVLNCTVTVVVAPPETDTPST